MLSDEKYMLRCLELGSGALGPASPNPMVGAVIVHNNQIIGEGYHTGFGQPHAEVHAIASVKDNTLLPASTLYVNLEPCSHFGKTPPCTGLIIKSGIKRVVIGTIDPNPLVRGEGLTRLREAGVEVLVDIMPARCVELNRRFFTYHTIQRPYTILKWAQTRDGFMDSEREPEAAAQPNWISNELMRMLVHKWRSEEQAIIVGTRTAITDNPTLTTRHWPGKNPLRLVIDRKLILSGDLNLFNGDAATVVFSEKKAQPHNNLVYVTLKPTDNMSQLMVYLYQLGIQSLIVEGGRALLQSFIDANTWDEARVITGQKLFHKGLSAPTIESEETLSMLLLGDKLTIYQNKPSHLLRSEWRH